MSIKPSAFQRRVMAVPEEFDLALLGGRGGGKSFVAAMLILRHIVQHKQHAKVLYVRRSHAALADFAGVCRDVFASAYGTRATFNSTTGVWSFPGGGFLELNQLDGAQHYSKYQGRSFSMLVADEIGEYSVPNDLDRLRSNLRAPKGVHVRMIVCGNPAGPGHHWVARRYVFKAAPWAPFLEEKSGRTWVHAPSVYSDNDAIDRDQYRAQLESACVEDAELLRAWTEGDWSVSRGAFFAGTLDEKRVAVDPWEAIPDGWSTFLCHDWGAAAPSATYLIAESPGGEGPDGRWYPRDSLVAVDELATHQPDNLAAGLNWPVPVVAEEIKAMCARWGVSAQGVADDACFANVGSSAGSIADEFAARGVRFRPAKKADRLAGWQILRRLFADAGSLDRPGLYVSRNCEFFWATAPYLGRDPRRIEDLDSRGIDHGVDSLRYGCMRLKWAKEINLRMVN